MICDRDAIKSVDSLPIHFRSRIWRIGWRLRTVRFELTSARNI